MNLLTTEELNRLIVLMNQADEHPIDVDLTGSQEGKDFLVGIMTNHRALIHTARKAIEYEKAIQQAPHDEGCNGMYVGHSCTCWKEKYISNTEQNQTKEES